MKKRIISVLLTSALVLSMAGCNSDTETPESTTIESAEATTTTTTAAVEEDTAEATTTTAPETEEATTTEAPPVETAKITTFSGLKNGYMAFSADTDKSYLYNIKDNVFTEIDSEYCTFQYGDDSVYATCITDNVAMIVTNPYENQCIGAVIDLSNGEIILEMNEDSDVSYAGQYNHITGDMLFIQKEESFEGNTIKFAVMNSKGEWLNDFSDSETFYEGKDYWHGKPFDGNLLMYKEDGNGGYSYYIYSLENKTHTPVNLPSDYWTFSSYGLGDKLLLAPYGFNPWYLLDGQGEITPLEYKVSGLSDYGILTEERKILDTETLEVIYDFSEYEDWEYYELYDYRYNVAIASPEERYAIKLENPNGDSYIGIFDKSGNELMKPFKGDFRWNPHYGFFSGDYFVAYEEFEGNVIANCVTGEVKTYEDTKDELGYYISGFDEESGLMIVKVDEYYYLVDPANPETLINPFEIAE